MAARLREHGVPVIDADQLAREAVAPGSEALAAIERLFGSEVIASDGTLDRKRVASIVFGDDEKRRALNAIVHPQVSRLTLEAASQLREAGAQLACYEAALIVENGVADAFRPLVVVSVPEHLQVERTVKRDGVTPDEALARIRAQISPAERIAAADYVIENAGSLDDLKRRTDEVLAAIRARLPTTSPPRT